MIPEIRTARLLLRAPTIEDFETYRRFFEDAAASKFYGGPLPSYRAWNVLTSDLGHWQLRGYGRWVMEEASSGHMVGSCGLWWPEGWPRSELTWWLLPDARDTGYATEASIAVIEFAYNQLKWPLVETHMDDANEAAARLVARLGGEVIAREVFPDGATKNVYGFPKPTSR